MTINYEEKFSRQAIPNNKKVGLVVPKNATIKEELPEHIKRIVSATGEPTSPPHKFSFDYIDYPFEDELLEDNAFTDNGLYKYSIKDALIQTFDLLETFFDDQFCWSFAVPDQLIVLAAIEIGSSFEINFKNPFPNSTSKCNEGSSYFDWFFEAQAFSGPVVD